MTYFHNDLDSAIQYTLLEYDHPISAEELVAHIHADESYVGSSLSVEEVIASISEKDIGADGKLVGNVDTSEPEIISAAFQRNLVHAALAAATGALPLLCVSAVKAVVDRAVREAHSGQVGSLRRLLKPGMTLTDLEALFNWVGRAEGVALLAERIKVGQWPRRGALEIGRLLRLVIIFRLKGTADVISEGDLYLIANGVPRKEGELGDGFLSVEDPLHKVSTTIATFPYDAWVLANTPPHGELYFPDIRTASLVFFGRSKNFWRGRNIHVTGKCQNEDERDALKLLFSVEGVKNDLWVGDVKTPSDIPKQAKTVFHASSGTPLSDQEQLRAYLFELGHRPERLRVFMVLPKTSLTDEGPWAELRTDMLERDILDCVIQLPGKQHNSESDLALILLDNQKPDRSKGFVYFDRAVNNLRITEMEESETRPSESPEQLEVLAFRAQQKLFSEERTHVKNVTVHLPCSELLRIKRCSLMVRMAFSQPFSALCEEHSLNELREFRKVDELLKADGRSAQEPMDKESVLGMLDPVLAIPKYVEQEFCKPYVQKQLTLMDAHWGGERILDCYVQAPRLEDQQEQIRLRENSWGLLPFRKGGERTKDWVADFVDNIQLHKKNSERCNRNVSFILNEVRRVERENSLEGTRESFADFRHNFAPLMGKLGDVVKRYELKREKAPFNLMEDEVNAVFARIEEFRGRAESLIDEQDRANASEVYRLEEVDLGRMVGDIGRWYSDRPGFQLLNHVEGCAVWADRSKLQQILENMVENALCHGKIDEVPLILGVGEVEGEDENGYADLVVANNGLPMTMARSEAVKRGSRSAKSQGTGLGLHMAKKWIEGMGGKFDERYLGAMGDFFGKCDPPMRVFFSIMLKRVVKHQADADPVDR